MNGAALNACGGLPAVSARFRRTEHVAENARAECFQLHNRRYIGNKHKLTEWIFSILNEECGGNSFADIFAGTGAIAAAAGKYFGKIILNDVLYSNQIIYKAFFGEGGWNRKKISAMIAEYNNINGDDLRENYFSENFGGKYFSPTSAKTIGFVRENIEKTKAHFPTGNIAYFCRLCFTRRIK